MPQHEATNEIDWVSLGSNYIQTIYYVKTHEMQWVSSSVQSHSEPLVDGSHPFQAANDDTVYDNEFSTDDSFLSSSL